MTKYQIELARDWISDCEWPDLDSAAVALLTDDQIIQGIEKHYDGGVKQFIIDVNANYVLH